MLGLAALALALANADPGHGYRRGGRYYGGYRRGYGHNYYGYNKYGRYNGRFGYHGSYKKAPYYAAKPLPHPAPVPVPVPAPGPVPIAEPVPVPAPAPIDDHAPLVIKELPPRKPYGYHHPVPVPHVVEEHVVPVPEPAPVVEVTEVQHVPVQQTVVREELVGHVVSEHPAGHFVGPVDAVPAQPATVQVEAVPAFVPAGTPFRAAQPAIVPAAPGLPPFGTRVVAQEALPVGEVVQQEVRVAGFPSPAQQVLLQPQPNAIFAQQPAGLVVQQPILPAPVPAVPDQPILA